MAAEEKQTVVVGVDESEHSLYALGWAIDHLIVPFLPESPVKLIVVYAKPSPISVLGGVGPGAAAVLPIVEADLKKVATGDLVVPCRAFLGSVSDYCLHNVSCSVLVVKNPGK